MFIIYLTAQNKKTCHDNLMMILMTSIKPLKLYPPKLVKNIEKKKKNRGTRNVEKISFPLYTK